MKEKILIGSYSNSIKICNLENGKIEIIEKIENVENPSFLHVVNNMVYAVSETKSGAILMADFKEGKIGKTYIQNIEQSLPCYITSNGKDRLLITNYESGSVILYKLKTNGKIDKEINKKQYQNSNMHFATFYKDEIYVTDLGNDCIYIFDASLELKSKILTPEKSGPRHLVIANDKIYVVTEFTNQVLVYKKQDSQYNLVQNISTLKDENILSYASAIKISKDYKYLYITNRGENSICVFSIYENSIKLVQNIASFGEFPRDILLNSDEKYALVANQKSNNITIFQRNINNGKLRKIQSVSIEKPACIIRSRYEV